MKEKIRHNLKYNIRNRLSRINLHRFKHLKGLIKRSIIALTLAALIILLQKINLRPTNSLLNLISHNIRAEVNLVREVKTIYNRAENLILGNEQIIKAFSPINIEKYPSPIKGSIHREYKKGQNQGIDIKAQSQEDPLSIIDGKVTNVEIRDKKGYFVTIEKENLQVSYGYLAKAHVSSGQEIKKGEAVGVLGTNKDQEKYLRLEIKVDGELVDPSEYIRIK